MSKVKYYFRFPLLILLGYIFSEILGLFNIITV
jgi:hypothetical protein